MKTLMRILCLGLCLAVTAPAALAQTGQDKKKTSQPSPAKSSSKSSSSKNKSGAKSKSGSKSKSKGKKEADAPAPAASRQPVAGVTGEGFRGLAWGSPLSALNEPDLREEGGGLKYYTVPGDNMDVMGVAMREIVYVFCQGALTGVLTRYDGEVNHLLVLGRLRDGLGGGVESPPNPRGDRSWRFDAGEETSAVVEYSPSPPTGAVAWMSRARMEPCRQP
jgi:hypothetical protein